MSKTKKDSLGSYEILFIVPNKFTEEEAKKVISNLRELIETNDGKITYEEYWGKKKLAYKIKHNEYGYYALYEFDLEREKLADLNRLIRLNNEVLRHQIILTKKQTEEEIQAKIAKKKEEANKKEEQKKDNKKDDVNTVESKKEEKKDEKKEDDKKETKENLKDLDEKLEGILNVDDLI